MPTTDKEMKSFLGTCNYYLRFIEGYAVMTASLYDAAKSKKIEWTEQLEFEFENKEKKEGMKGEEGRNERRRRESEYNKNSEN